VNRRRLLALLASAVLAAAVAAGCGGSAATDVAPYLGVWQRVEAGEPNPDFTLTIARRDDAAGVTFASAFDATSQTVTATAADGFLACTLPTGKSGLQSAEGGAPARADLQLSLDDNGQLVVDLVLADGTLEPVWIYERAAASSPPEP
jgi:hypothetical protein